MVSQKKRAKITRIIVSVMAVILSLALLASTMAWYL